MDIDGCRIPETTLEQSAEAFSTFRRWGISYVSIWNWCSPRKRPTRRGIYDLSSLLNSLARCDPPGNLDPEGLWLCSPLELRHYSWSNCLRIRSVFDAFGLGEGLNEVGSGLGSSGLGPDWGSSGLPLWRLDGLDLRPLSRCESRPGWVPKSTVNVEGRSRRRGQDR